MNKKANEIKQVVGAVTSGAMTDDQAAGHWGRDVRTVRSWVKKYPEYKVAPLTKKLTAQLSPKSGPEVIRKTMDQVIFFHGGEFNHPDDMEAALMYMIEQTLMLSMGKRISYTLVLSELINSEVELLPERKQAFADRVYSAARLLAFTSGRPAKVHWMCPTKNDSEVFKLIKRQEVDVLSQCTISTATSGYSLHFTNNPDGFPRLAFGRNNKLSTRPNVITNTDTIRAHTQMRQTLADTFNITSHASVAFLYSGRASIAEDTRASIGRAKEGYKQLLVTLHQDGNHDFHLIAPRLSKNKFPALPVQT